MERDAGAIMWSIVNIATIGTKSCIYVTDEPGALVHSADLLIIRLAKKYSAV